MAKGGTKGSLWEYILYFYTNAGDIDAPIYEIADDQLRKKFRKIVSEDEKILCVEAYKTPLDEKQVTKFLIYHMFIIFETDDWWWSIEKCRDAIVLQRSKSRRGLKNKCRQQDRLSPISLILDDMGCRSVYKLIDWLHSEDELNNVYHIMKANCKHFGKRIFGYIAKTKDLYWYHGAFTDPI